MSIDKRRFPRINLGDLAKDLKVISEAQLVALDGQKVELDVFDISYDSLAFRNSGDSLKLSQELKVQLNLAGYAPETFQSTVVRLQGDLVALKLEGVTAEQRLSLEGFLKDKMIGVNTYLVAKEFYSKKEDFSHWFHGPNSTNFIIWRQGDEVQKAILEMNTDVLSFENDQWELNESEKRSEDAPQEDYLVQLKDNKTEQVPVALFERAMNIMGQMLVTVPPHQRTVLQFLLSDLKKQIQKRSN